jgi:uncharacterized protein YbjT (DUF2867 family)
MTARTISGENMKIAVAGGTGTVGHHVVEVARAAGHETTVLSRSTGVDVRSSTTLSTALAGVDVLIDTLNPASIRRAAAESFFTSTAARLQEAAARVGVAHVVVLSILGVEQVPAYGYFQAKLAQERTVAEGPVPATILRAAQFYEFAGQMVRLTRRGPIALVPRMRSQPVAARSAAEHLVRLAEAQRGGREELAGPEVHEIPELARRLVAARGEQLRVIGFPFPGAAGRQMRGDGLLAGPDTVIDGPSFTAWLTNEDARQVPLS